MKNNNTRQSYKLSDESVIMYLTRYEKEESILDKKELIKDYIQTLDKIKSELINVSKKQSIVNLSNAKSDDIINDFSNYYEKVSLTNNQYEKFYKRFNHLHSVYEKKERIDVADEVHRIVVQDVLAEIERQHKIKKSIDFVNMYQSLYNKTTFDKKYSEIVKIQNRESIDFFNDILEDETSKIKTKAIMTLMCNSKNITSVKFADVEIEVSPQSDLAKLRKQIQEADITEYVIKNNFQLSTQFVFYKTEIES
tara:strand:+ start:2273 stop:3028 length:756 start_codon:yes stop_codon:yes gene_type:complete